tara:strand:+ start:267 stop:482 length:216 start_codon:yes stop_codon:yes gene_type:complete
LSKAIQFSREKPGKSTKIFNCIQLSGKMLSLSLSRSKKIYSKYIYKKELEYWPMIHCKDYSWETVDRVQGE